MMVNDAFRSGGVSSAEPTRIHSERFASLKTSAAARTRLDAFRSGDLSLVGSVRIHSEPTGLVE
jgi:hypothetical protein